MTPRYAFMVAVLLGPFGCDSDPGRGPKPETRAIALGAAPSAARLQHLPEGLGGAAERRDGPEQADLEGNVLPG
jgi:hypothetical protein